MHAETRRAPRRSGDIEPPSSLRRREGELGTRWARDAGDGAAWAASAAALWLLGSESGSGGGEKEEDGAEPAPLFPSACRAQTKEVFLLRNGTGPEERANPPPGSGWGGEASRGRARSAASGRGWAALGEGL